MTKLKIDVSDGTNGATDEEGVLSTIDFSDWHFSPEQNDELKTALANVVRSEIADAFRNTLREDPPDIEFVSDGANIWVTINLGSNWNDGRIWFTASIEAMIDEYIENTWAGSMAGGDEAKIELAQCLRACVAKLEKAIEDERTAGEE